MCFESAPSSRQISPKNKVLERNKSILKANLAANNQNKQYVKQSVVTKSQVIKTLKSRNSDQSDCEKNDKLESTYTYSEIDADIISLNE